VTRTGKGLGVWGRPIEPIVAKADADTARRLGLSLAALRELTAGLEPWPWRHADGSRVWRWRDLLAATGQTPIDSRGRRGGRARAEQRRKAEHGHG
jgi:hypothetical protein